MCVCVCVFVLIDLQGPEYRFKNDSNCRPMERWMCQTLSTVATTMLTKIKKIIERTTPNLEAINCSAKLLILFTILLVAPSSVGGDWRNECVCALLRALRQCIRTSIIIITILNTLRFRCWGRSTTLYWHMAPKQFSSVFQWRFRLQMHYFLSRSNSTDWPSSDRRFDTPLEFSLLVYQELGHYVCAQCAL